MWLLEEHADYLDTLNFDDHDYLRFCRARTFVLDDVKTMLANYIKWRKENEIDFIVDNFPQNTVKGIMKYYEHGNHHIDKLNRPIFIIRVGDSDVHGLFKNHTIAEVEQESIYRFEIG